MPGTLYIVSTPIGNLEDITLRALRILKEVVTIAAEDTRHTQKLLSHFDIHVPLTSYHDFNKEEKTPVLISRMMEGASVALVADAGTPTISDPGFYLIREAIRAGLPVSPIPGPAAAVAALSVSGLPTDRFVFEGFLPKKKGARVRRLETLRDDPRTLIFYESPYRIVPLLEEIRTVLGDRPAVVSREMTKLFEEFIRGSVTEVIEKIGKRSLKGEITLVVGGNRGEERPERSEVERDDPEE
ncbi:MAG TPA: 16S rRNA (cytidine(1402)-2'-O)-methyltransferase [Candidatus Manganitrophaceae bacterium]|nr:16S rRNA (cytidine(1402)-2'-O)-methyltransferase [Candidatus Manganitrophaceae bacterium]